MQIKRERERQDKKNGKLLNAPQSFTYTQSGVRLKIKAWKPIKYTTTILSSNNDDNDHDGRSSEQQQIFIEKHVEAMDRFYFLFYTHTHTINPAYREFCLLPFLLSSSFPRALRSIALHRMYLSATMVRYNA